MEYEIEAVRDSVSNIEDSLDKLKNSSCCSKYEISAAIQNSLDRIRLLVDDIEEEYEEMESPGESEEETD